VVDYLDRELGWDDGIIDGKDNYAKIDGNVGFAVDVAAWEAATGKVWQDGVSGSIDAEYGSSASQFALTEAQLAELTTEMFAGAQTWFETESMSGAPFGDPTTGQIQSNLHTGGSYVPAQENEWESIPWESEGAYDWYQRPVYKNMVFKNVRIPRGTNAMFEDCMFVGVTWLETTEEVSDPNWNFAGAVEPDGYGNYTTQFSGLVAASGGVEYPDTRDVSNNIRFHDCTFLGSIA